MANRVVPTQDWDHSHIVERVRASRKMVEGEAMTAKQPKPVKGVTLRDLEEAMGQKATYAGPLIPDPDTLSFTRRITFGLKKPRPLPKPKRRKP